MPAHSTAQRPPYGVFVFTETCMYVYVYACLNNMNFTDILTALMKSFNWRSLEIENDRERERHSLKGTHNATGQFTS